MDGIIVKLSKPIEAFGHVINEVALKEPTGALYLRLGEPRLAVITAESGSYYFVEQAPTINNYLDKLLTFDGGDDVSTPAILAQLSLVDAHALKKALFSFFDIAAMKVAAVSSVSKR